MVPWSRKDQEHLAARQPARPTSLEQGILAGSCWGKMGISSGKVVTAEAQGLCREASLSLTCPAALPPGNNKPLRSSCREFPLSSGLLWDQHLDLSLPFSLNTVFNHMPSSRHPPAPSSFTQLWPVCQFRCHCEKLTRWTNAGKTVDEFFLEIGWGLTLEFAQQVGFEQKAAPCWQHLPFAPVTPESPAEHRAEPILAKASCEHLHQGQIVQADPCLCLTTLSSAALCHGSQELQSFLPSAVLPRKGRENKTGSVRCTGKGGTLTANAKTLGLGSRDWVVGIFLFLPYPGGPSFTTPASGLERNTGRGKICSPSSHSNSLLEKGVQDTGETEIIK